MTPRRTQRVVHNPPTSIIRPPRSASPSPWAGPTYAVGMLIARGAWTPGANASRAAGADPIPARSRASDHQQRGTGRTGDESAGDVSPCRRDRRRSGRRRACSTSSWRDRRAPDPGVQFSLQPLAPGPHTLRVELQDWPGGRRRPPRSPSPSSPPPRRPAASWWMAGTVAAVVALLFIGLLLLWLCWVRPVQVHPLYDADETET